ncbi:hypothetical protein X975_21861, partial [Stegodyphus mimosarum]
MEKKKSLKLKYQHKGNEQSCQEKLEVLEEKYVTIKNILKQVLKELKAEKESHELLIKQCEKLNKELKEKDEFLERLQSVSEAVVDEYNTLKVKYELEIEAATDASKRATKYFQENQLLRKKALSVQESSDIDIIDTDGLTSDETNSELEVCQKVASDLRSEVASLQTQLQKEYEKQNSLKEDFEIAKKLYEQEMIDHNETKKELESLRAVCKGNAVMINKSQDKNNDVEEASSVATVKERKFSEEFCSLISEVNFDTLGGEIHIAEQPDTVLGGASCQDNLDTTIKRISQQARNLQELRVPDETNGCEHLPKKLEMAQQQLHSYERENARLLKRVEELEGQVQRLNDEISTSKSVPPPPPPPPPPTLFKPIRSFITFISSSKKTPRTSPKKDANFENPHQKAMVEMIDAIKKGNIQLKPTPKNVSPDKQESSAVGEMENILKTFKKRDWPSVSANLADQKEKTDDFQKSLPLGEASTSHSTHKAVEDKRSHDELHIIFRKKSLQLAENEGQESVISDTTDANISQ